MNERNIVIKFDLETWVPMAILCNGTTDKETAELREIVSVMLRALPEKAVSEKALDGLFKSGHLSRIRRLFMR